MSYIGDNKIGFFVGSGKIKKAFIGEEKVYSAGGIARYIVDTDVEYLEEIDDGGDCLSPKTFTPTKSGWNFVGWREDSTASSTVLSEKTMTGEGVTLYAVFSADVTATLYNGSNTETTDVKPKYYNNEDELGASFTLTQNTISDWSNKKGWNTTKDSSEKTIDDGSTVTITDDTTYYSLYANNVVCYKYNGSTTQTSETKERLGQFNGTGKTWDPSFTLSESAVSGWTAAGWTTSNSGYSATVANGGTVTLSSNATYYSLYTASITVTKYNGSTSTSTESKNRVANYHSDVSYSNPSFTLSQSAVSGWTAAGWTTSASGYSATVANGGTVTISSNATYYSLYTKAVKVNWYNNSTTVSTETKNRIANYHNAVTYSNPTFNRTVTAVSGWSVRGWSTTNTGNASISYNSATNFTRDSDVTLYGLYQKTVTVSYNGNGNTGGSTSSSTGTAYRNASGGTVNASISIRANGFSKTNYSFYRWRTAASSGTIYAVSATYSSTSDATLYAYWIADATSFNYTGGVQSFTALAGVTYMFQVYGAQGGGPRGGKGGYALGYKKFTANTNLYICVGGKGTEGLAGPVLDNLPGGYNGGGKAAGCGFGGSNSGGGATHIAMTNNRGVLSNYNSYRGEVIIVAGGGGGGCSSSTYGSVNGGAGGGTSGGSIPDGGGNGGTQTAGGANSQMQDSKYPTTLSASGFGVGGGWYSGNYGNNYFTCQSGGGGYFGGGASARLGQYQGRGGGGGSGYIGGVTDGSMNPGQRSGDGYARILVWGISQ